MVQYRRNRVPGGTYFFTVTLADRDGSTLVDHIESLGAAFRDCRRCRPFETIAIAVLPEHLHCIWTMPGGDADYSARWSIIKRAFTRDRRRGAGGPRPRPIWQPRFWEHTIRDDRDLESHVNYIHFNPVKHGLVARALDWPHSSFHRYVRRGWLKEDWACDDDFAGHAYGE